MAALLCASAYLQATGVNALIASAFGPEAADFTRSAAARTAGPAPSVASRRTGKPILERNPFDSVTGPLTGNVAGETEEPVERFGIDDPLGAPMCSDIEVHGTTVASDPHWSLAMVQVRGQPHGELRRIGDAVSDRQVAYIGFNRRLMSPAVWFENQTGLCQSLVFSKVQPKAAAARKAPKPQAKKAPKRGGGPPALPKKIADKIQKLGPTEFNVDRSAIDEILEQHAQLMKSVRVAPVQKNGRVSGIRVVRIRPDTLLGKLGFQNGDQIDNINGFALSSPEKALQAYARLRTAPNISVKVERHGKPISIDFHVK